jgi:hypothetical protein
MDNGAGRLATASTLAAWCLLAIGDSAHAGYYAGGGIACVLLGFVVLAGTVARGGALTPPTRGMLAVTGVVVVVEAVIDPTKTFTYLHGADLHATQALGVATALAGTAALLSPPRLRRMTWTLVVVLAIATGVVMIVLLSNPGIDVWELLQQSSTGLLHGADMYRQHWSGTTGLQAVYPYLPATTLLLAPFRWLFGDVRFGLLTASVIAALVVHRFGHRESARVAALLLVMPGWSLLVARSWTEPLLFLGLSVAILAMRSGHRVLMVAGLVAAVACKQHVVLLLPLFALWPGFGWRRTASATGLAALTVVPWLIAGPGDLWHDAVHANLSLGARTRALNISAVLLRHGIHVGFWLAGLGLVVSYALVLWRAPRTASGLALSCATVIWAFDLTNTQTFFNHYTLPLGLLVLAVAMAERPPTPVTQAIS